MTLKLTVVAFHLGLKSERKMLEAVFGSSIEVSKNYTFRAPFWRYLPPLLSPVSWKLRKQILEGVPKDYFTYTGDKAEGIMLKIYRLNPKIGVRKSVSASSVKNKLYDSARGKNTTWKDDVPSKVVEIIKQHWDVVEKYANVEDETTRIAGMKFPKDGYWSK